MTETKPWWQSRTIWASIVGAVYAVLAFFNILPAELTSEQVLEGIMAIVSIATMFYRARAEKKLTTTQQ